MTQRLRVHFSFELREVRFHALIRTVQIIRILSYVQRTVLIERPKVWSRESCYKKDSDCGFIKGSQVIF